MKNIVCKFGGSSLANSRNIMLVSDIILSKGRNYVVVSAPGKRYKDDTKITDALIECYNNAKHSQSFEKPFSFVKSRFYQIVQELGIKLDLTKIFDEISAKLLESPQYDYVVSRGEYICAIILSKHLKYDFIDAKDFIIFNDLKEVDIKESKSRLQKLVKTGHRYVIPGFYGSDKNGNIMAFSRGGSDITGAILSMLLNAKVYENYTDVDGIMSVNPALYENAKIIPLLSYDELRCLSFSGANVLHSDCAMFLKENDIKLNLLNTFNPQSSGSMVCANNTSNKIVAISSLGGLSAISIHSYNINFNISKIKKVLSLLVECGVNIYHLQFGLDCLNVLTMSNEDAINSFMRVCREDFAIDSVDVTNNLAIISIVGECIISSKEIENKIYSLIASTHYNYHSISKNDRNPEIMLVVEEKDVDAITCYINEELSK